MKRAAAVITAALWLVAGCGKQLDHGVVTGKTHAAEQQIMIPQYYTSCSGSPPSCTQQLSGFLPIWIPEHWELELRDGDQTGSHDVSESEFNRYHEGDEYPAPDDQKG